MSRPFSKPRPRTGSRGEPSIDLGRSEPGNRAALSPPQSPFADGARVRALLRGVQLAEQDLKDSGGALDLEQVRALLRGISRQSVEKRVREGQLLAVPGPGGRRYYPAVQFDNEGSTVPGLREVMSALSTRNGYATLNFLVRPDSRLDNRRPIDLMKAGEVELVLKAARAIGDPGA